MLKTVGNPSTRYGDQTIDGGDLVIGTAGNGVDFSVNTGAPGMTSELLDWYEEGTWTPSPAASYGSITSFTSTGTYTRVGRQVTLLGEITITDAGTGAGYLSISGIPFNIANSFASGSGREIALTGNACSVNYSSATAVDLNDYANANLVATGRKYSFVVVYFV